MLRRLILHVIHSHTSTQAAAIKLSEQEGVEEEFMAFRQLKTF